VRKILEAVTISGSESTNPIYCKSQLFYKFKYKKVNKMKNKPDPDLSGSSYLFNEIKKRSPKSSETIPISFFLLKLEQLTGVAPTVSTHVVAPVEQRKENQLNNAGAPARHLGKS
jgi:hypothetical protein